MSRGLCALLLRIDCVLPAVNNAVVDAVLDVRAVIGSAENALRVGFVLGEQERWISRGLARIYAVVR
jgi:hypothetical protein